MGWTSTRSREVCEVLVHCVEQSHRRDAATTDKKRPHGRAAHGVRTSAQCHGATVHELAGDLPGRTRQQTCSAIQILEELVRKFKECTATISTTKTCCCRGRGCNIHIYIYMLHVYILNRFNNSCLRTDESATCDFVKANTWRML